MGIWMTMMTLDPTLACRSLVIFKLRFLITSLHSRIFVFDKGVTFSSPIPFAVDACMPQLYVRLLTSEFQFLRPHHLFNGSTLIGGTTDRF